MFILRQASGKMAVLLHKQAKVPFILIIAVVQVTFSGKGAKMTSLVHISKFKFLIFFKIKNPQKQYISLFQFRSFSETKFFTSFSETAFFSLIPRNNPNLTALKQLTIQYRNYAKNSCTIFFYFSLFGATQWSFGLIFLPLQHRFGRN